MLAVSDCVRAVNALAPDNGGINIVGFGADGDCTSASITVNAGTAPTLAAIAAWLAANPNPQATYAAAIAAGLATTWSTSTALNATYPLGADPITGMAIQGEIQAEMIALVANGSFTNGQATRGWPTLAGAYETFNVAQFKALATAIALYLDQLAAALATAGAGGTASWPAPSVTIAA